MMASGRHISVASLVIALFLPLISWAGDCDDCGEISEGHEWRCVMLLDGSNSMAELDLWKPMLESMRKLAKGDQAGGSLPPGTKLQIVVFNGLRAQSNAPQYIVSPEFAVNEERKSPGAVDYVKQLMRGDGQLAGARFLDNPGVKTAAGVSSEPKYSKVDGAVKLPNGGTPLYIALHQCFGEMERWWNEDPRQRSFQILLYSDGDDNGYKGKGENGIDHDFVNGQIENLKAAVREQTGRDPNDFWQIRLDRKSDRREKVIEISGMKFLDADGGIPALPYRSVECSLPTKILEPLELVPGSTNTVETTLSLMIDVPCMPLLSGDEVIALSATLGGGMYEAQVSPPTLVSRDIGKGGEVEVTLTIKGLPAATQLAGLNGVLHVTAPGWPDTFEKCGGNRKMAFRNATLDFVVKKSTKVTLEESAIRWFPEVPLVGDVVRIYYFPPQAGVEPHWTLSRERIDPLGYGDNDWSIATREVVEHGKIQVELYATRGIGQEIVKSNTVTATISVPDLSLKISGPSDAMEGQRSAFQAIATPKSVRIVETKWRLDGLPVVVADEDEPHSISVEFERGGKQSLTLKAKVDLGKDDFIWVVCTDPHVVDVQEKPHVGIEPITRSLVWGGEPLSVVATTRGNVKHVQFELLDSDENPLSPPVKSAEIAVKSVKKATWELELPSSQSDRAYVVRAVAVNNRDAEPATSNQFEVALPTCESSVTGSPSVTMALGGELVGFTCKTSSTPGGVITHVQWELFDPDGAPVSTGVVPEAKSLPKGLGDGGTSTHSLSLPLHDGIRIGRTYRLQATPLTKIGSVWKRWQPAEWEIATHYEPPAWKIVPLLDIAHADPQFVLNWGEETTFTLHSFDDVLVDGDDRKVEFTLSGKGSPEPMHAASGDEIGHPFDLPMATDQGRTALIVNASVTADHPDLLSKPFPATPLEIIVVAKAVRLALTPQRQSVRGESNPSQDLKIEGSIKDLKLLASMNPDGSDPSTHIDLNEQLKGFFTPGSSHTPITVVVPKQADNLGELYLFALYTTPDGQTSELKPLGSVEYRPGRQWTWFLLVLLASLIVLYKVGGHFVGNHPRHWQVKLATDEENLKKSGLRPHVCSISVKKYWSRGNKMALVPFNALSAALDAKWEDDPGSRPGKWLAGGENEAVLQVKSSGRLRLRGLNRDSFELDALLQDANLKHAIWELKSLGGAEPGLRSVYVSLGRSSGFPMDEFVALVVFFVCAGATLGAGFNWLA